MAKLTRKKVKVSKVILHDCLFFENNFSGSLQEARDSLANGGFTVTLIDEACLDKAAKHAEEKGWSDVKIELMDVTDWEDLYTYEVTVHGTRPETDAELRRRQKRHDKTQAAKDKRDKKTLKDLAKRRPDLFNTE